MNQPTRPFPPQLDFGHGLYHSIGSKVRCDCVCTSVCEYVRLFVCMYMCVHGIHMCVHMCTYVYICVDVCMDLCVCVCLWRPDVTVQCLPRLLLTLLFETESHKTQSSPSQQDWLAGKPQASAYTWYSECKPERLESSHVDCGHATEPSLRRPGWFLLCPLSDTTYHFL